MSRLALTLLLLVTPLLVRAQAVLYIASGGGNISSLYTVNPATAQTTLVGSILHNGTTSLTVTALAFHPTTGTFYGVSGNEYSPSRQLMIINPSTGHATSVGTIGTASAQNTSDISFASNGTLYGWTVKGGPLVTVDIANATRTVIGSAMNGTQSNGLAFAPNGTLYLAGPTSSANLYTVDTTTGVITQVANLTSIPTNFGNINAMAFDPSGTLYAVGSGSGHQLVTINTSTGAFTVMGTLPWEADSIAFKAVPEPSVLALLVVGGLVGLLVRHGRRAA